VKKILLLFLIFIKVYGWEDSDMDGVSNIDDLCPNTSFEYIVDKKGCPINGNIGKLSLILGTNINRYDNSTTQDYSFSLNYLYKLWSISIYSSQDYIDDTISKGDLYLSFYYNIIGEKLITKLSMGIKFATGNDEISTGENDYFTSINFKYLLSNDITLLSTISYTITGDTKDKSYKNPIGYSLGLGYSINNKWDIALSYQNSNSIYEDSQNYSAISISSSYTINSNIWASLGYTKGLDELSYDDIFSFKIGINFE